MGTNEQHLINDPHYGLSKREYFAGLAMQGMLVNGAQTQNAGRALNPETIAFLALNQANELIKQLNQTQK